MYFPSVRDKWITILVWGIALSGVIIPLVNQYYITTLFMLVLSLLLLWFWFRTGYKIEGKTIKIYYGPIRQTIQIPDINQVIISKMPINSPALSMDRIQISAGKYEVVAISPQNREQFISRLLDIRPDIPMDKEILPKTHRK